MSAPTRTLRNPMVAREPTEAHRVASALELFFDLCFVVAVSQAASRLHHSYLEGTLHSHFVNYLFVFFAIWWAWMNFTWFASAYDNDSITYRLTVALQIAGVLILAAGVPRAFDSRDAHIMTYGYAVMRIAQGSQWLRVAKSDPQRRVTALRYGGGQLALQVLWLVALTLPAHAYLPVAGVIILLELAVPAWAETAGATSWHPHHISERYSLFFLIVLGEAVLATTVAIQTAIDSHVGIGTLLSVMIGGFVIVFSMWWLYFFRPGHEFLKQGPIAFLWGYGHYFIFASTAAVGAGLEIAVDQLGGLEGGEHHLGATATHLELAVPIAVFLVALWALHWPDAKRNNWHWYQLPITAIVVYLVSLSSQAYWLMALIVATSLTVKVVSAQRNAAPHV